MRAVGNSCAMGSKILHPHSIFVGMLHRQAIRDIQVGSQRLASCMARNLFYDDCQGSRNQCRRGVDARFQPNRGLRPRHQCGPSIEAARRFHDGERQLVLMREVQDWPAWRRKDDMVKLRLTPKLRWRPRCSCCFKTKPTAASKPSRLSAKQACVPQRESARQIAGVDQQLRPRHRLEHFAAAAILAEYLGNDLRQGNELTKLSIVLPRAPPSSLSNWKAHRHQQGLQRL